jgi:ATPase subunit of ABC transporter with duplicated ATPase domains
MPIVAAAEVEKSYADAQILSGATFAVEPDERVALIGRNGTGKTTLLRLIAGLDRPDRGRVALAGWVKLAYLPQTPQGPSDATVMGHVLAGAADVHALAARIHDLEHLMATTGVHDDPDRLAAVMEEYAHVREHFEHAGGFTLETRARMVLSGLGFREADHERPLGVLSGGWRVRAELARALLGEPDLLLLDEPTNHLDLATTEWLEEYLGSFPGAVILVSHDRYLLDAVTSRTLELEDGLITAYPGPYSAYVKLKTEKVKLQQEIRERQQEEIAKLKDFIRRYKAGQRAAQAHSREKMLERVKADLGDAPREQRGMRVRMPSAPSSGRQVVRLRHVTKAFDGRDVLSRVDLEIYRGERIGLLGPNGAGKSTLVKIGCGLVRASAGTATVCGAPAGSREARAAMGYLAELFRFPDWASADEVLALHQRLAGSAGGEAERSELLELVGLADARDRRVAAMSKGMQQRLGIAQALVGSPRFLFLDEPTSALDPGGRRTVRGLLEELRGRGIAILLNSHLLTEVELVCDRVAILSRGRIVAEGKPSALSRPRGVEVDVGSGTRLFEGATRDDAPRIVSELVAAGERVYGVRVLETSLEEVYLEAVGGEAG